MSQKEITLPEGMDIEEAVDVLGEYAKTENAQIVNQENYETLQSNVEELASVFREDLKDRKNLADETVEGLAIDALTAEYRNDDGEIEFETLEQSPETGTTQESGSSGTNEVLTEVSDTLGRDFSSEDEAVDILQERYERFDAMTDGDDTWARKKEEAKNQLEKFGVTV